MAESSSRLRTSSGPIEIGANRLGYGGASATAYSFHQTIGRIRRWSTRRHPGSTRPMSRLRSHGAGLDLPAPITSTLLAGGYSWRTYQVTGADGSAVVLRIAPRGGTLEPYDPAIEARALIASRRLGAGASRVLAVNARRSEPFGDPYLIQSMAPGRCCGCRRSTTRPSASGTARRSPGRSGSSTATATRPSSGRRQDRRPGPARRTRPGRRAVSPGGALAAPRVRGRPALAAHPSARFP